MWLAPFTTLTGILNGGLNAWLDQVLLRDFAYVGSFIIFVCAIAFVIKGAQIMLGMTQSPASVLATIGVVIFVMLLTSQSLYSAWVRQTILVTLPNDLAALAGKTTDAVQHAYDVLWNTAMDAGWTVWEKLWGLKLILVVVYFALAIVVIAAGYGIWAASFFMSVIYVAIGPIMVPLVLFNFTRPMVSAWAGSMLSCVMLQLLSVMLTSLVVGVEGYFLGKIINDTTASAQMQVGMLLFACAIFLLAGFMVLRLPGIAATICGGVHWTPVALANATYGAAGKATAAIAGGAINLMQNRASAARANLGAASNRPPTQSLSRSGGTP